MDQLISGTEEAARIRRLRSFDILDTPREATFDRIVFTAAQLFRTPIALVTFVDEHRQWHKAHVGLIDREIPRSIAFCTETIKSGDVLVVEDATLDIRFATSEIVTRAPFVRFYAGAPLITSDGFRLGAMCLIDRQARTLSAKQAGQLTMLARNVMDLLDARMPQPDVRPGV